MVDGACKISSINQSINQRTGKLPCRILFQKLLFPKLFEILPKNQRPQRAKTPNFFSDNTENSNKSFLLNELKDALNKSNETAAGPDGLYYQFLTHLPQDCLKILLQLLNTIWLSGKIPSSWKEAIVVPIPKPNKDLSDPTNYRPIALTSCLCKTMERMVNERLV